MRMPRSRFDCPATYAALVRILLVSQMYPGPD
ncbi:MAG: hypothetical protein QOF43_2268, partial [Gaiellaceae bacterium]|nr:hypothetical protein [Gaiellaceae bacterium]